MALEQDYYPLWFESFELSKTSGHRDKIGLCLRKGQELPEEIEDECSDKGLNPFELLTECSRSLFYDYPVGTEFLLKTKLTDKEGGGTFFYTHYTWAPLEIVKP
jgi:hypothetical protein